MKRVTRKSEIENAEWLPDMDLNHDKVIQSHLCYRYTIGQAEAGCKLKGFPAQSRVVARSKGSIDESFAIVNAVLLPQGSHRSTNPVFNN
jgi:hypothetical protein